MTRQLTSDSIKRKLTVDDNARLQRLPRKGTKIRDLYDRLYENAGAPTETTVYERRSLFPQLVNFYGCDIRWCGRGLYRLVGELVDNVYIDYVDSSPGQTRNKSRL